MPAVVAEALSKTYRVADKQPGLAGTLRHFVRRRHRDIPAVQAINLSIEPGEIVGFLGANGAGKTTAIKMLTGLLHPTAGRAEVLGFRPFERKRELLRQITLVMGNKQQLIWDLPTLDSLRINAAIYQIPEKVARQRTEELAGLLQLEKELTQPVRKLSLGQRMKCELVAALLHHPKVLFLDEPTLGLDIAAQTAVRRFLREYNRQHGAAMLLTSHYMADITALCPRVVVIHQGRMRYDGELGEVVRRLSPMRELKIDLEEGARADQLHAADPTFLARFGQVEHCQDRSIRLLVERDRMTEVTAALLGALPVADLTVTDPPIEEVIGRLFQEAATDEPAPPPPTAASPPAEPLTTSA